MAANDLVFFENNYVQSSDDFAPEDLGPDTPKTAVLGCVTIDGYTAEIGRASCRERVSAYV